MHGPMYIENRGRTFGPFRKSNHDLPDQNVVTILTDLSRLFLYNKVKWSRYRPGLAQRVGRDIALLFHDRGTRRGWVVSSTPRPQFTPGKDPVPILQEVGWALGPVWTGGIFLPHRASIPDRPARSQSHICIISYLIYSTVVYFLSFFLCM